MEKIVDNEAPVEKLFDEWFETFDPDVCIEGFKGDIMEFMIIAYKAGFEKASEFDWY